MLFLLELCRNWGTQLLILETSMQYHIHFGKTCPTTQIFEQSLKQPIKSIFWTHFTFMRTSKTFNYIYKSNKVKIQIIKNFE